MGKILRRTFLIGTAAIAGGVAFGTYVVKKPYDNPLEGETAQGESTFNPYVKITKDNQITIIAPRAEMGQGVSTSLAALVAEELDVEMSAIKVEHGPTSHAYFNNAMMEDAVPFPHYRRDWASETTRSAMKSVGKVLGVQATGGSTATKDAWVKMREAGCAARETLKLAAANREGISIDQLKTEKGHVIAGTKKIPYGELAEAAAKLDPPSDMKLKADKDWKIIGKSTPRTDMHAKVTGAPIFGIDVRLPDMLFATIRMNPRLGGKMNGYDSKAALKVPGVVKVIDMTSSEDEKFGGGFAVIATNTWAAFQGADAVEADWGEAPYPPTSEEISKSLQAAIKNPDATATTREDGDALLAFADAPREEIIEAEYSVPYLAHATMEPMNATAWLRDGKLDVWCGHQAPTLAVDHVAQEAGVDKENVDLHVTFLGGGFGRRFEIDAPKFAARVAKATDGKPVQVVWQREEDMTHDTYRPASIAKLRARVDENGLPTSIDWSLASPSIIASVMGRTFPSLAPAGPDSTMVQGAFDQAYGFENFRLRTSKADIDIPIGFWRSVGHSYNAHYLETFLDEVAAKSGKDPLDLRLALLKHHPEALGVLNKVAEMSSWKSPTKPNHGKGLAFHLAFGSWVAQVIEVSNSSDGIKIENVWCACDLGTVVDPAIVKTQMQSGIIYGLSAAMNQEITFADGMVEQTNFDTYDAMRMNQCPNIEVEIVSNATLIGGAGEPGTPPSFPALGNAIFAATGKRIRTMPFSKEIDFAS